MAPNNSPATITRKIIQLILSKTEVHYQDLIDYTGTSRKTVAKYLKQVESIVNEQGVKLIRKRGQGIYFQGDVDNLLAVFPSLTPQSQNEDERRISIMTFLTQYQAPILLDDLAEKFYISRSTLERDLASLKNQYGFKLISTPAGIRFNSSEEKVRRITSQLLQSYWSQEVHQNQKTGQINRTFNVPDSLKQYVESNILDRTEKVLNQFINDLKVEINEYQYESLLIHTTIAIQRIKKGEYISRLKEENLAIDTISPSTNKLVKLLSREFCCDIPDEEVSYLNIHVVAIEDSYIDLNRNGVIEQAMIDWLKKTLSDYDDTLLRNLVLHLKPALARAKNQISIANPYIKQIKAYFPTAFERALDLTILIDQHYHLQLTEDEIGYLALHFESFMERNKTLKLDVRMAIVCSTGYGTAELLKQRVADKLPDIQIIGTLSVNELMEKPIKADIIISTIPLKMNDAIVIQVSPFLDENEIEVLKKISTDVRKKKYASKAFIQLLSLQGIIVNTTAQDKRTAIIQLTDKLNEAGYVDSHMQVSALERESLASTVIDNFAIPHGDIDHVLKPTIGIMTSVEGISWDKDKVHLVFFIALNRSVEEQMDDIYSYFYDLIQNTEKMSEIIKAEDAQTVLEKLKCL